jgi:hypothetical protein
MRARCVITEHLADRHKSPVWSTEAIYLLGSTAGPGGVPEGRSAALIYAGAPGLNWHRTWSGCGNGHAKGASSSLDIRNQAMSPATEPSGPGAKLDPQTTPNRP